MGAALINRDQLNYPTWLTKKGNSAIREAAGGLRLLLDRRLERRVRELERLLGRKTMEVEILKEALDVARIKKPSSSCIENDKS